MNPETDPVTPGKPVRLVSKELAAISAVLTKLSALEPFKDETELDLTGISMNYEVNDTMVGRFSYSYSWDSWFFEPALTTEDQE